MSAREHGGEWVVKCDGTDPCDCPCGGRWYCVHAVVGPSLVSATSHATRAGWVTRPVTVDIDGVPRQRVEHYCPAHKGVTE